MSPFIPNATFELTLAGSTYQATTVWNVYGGRWYVDLRTLTGARVAFFPVVASSDTSDINLVAPWIPNGLLVFRASNQTWVYR